ncbi:hypothetical protein [Clostridium botulinum]
MTKVYRSNNIFHFTVPKGDFNSMINKLEESGLTKEDLEKCQRVANLYKKVSKK